MKGNKKTINSTIFRNKGQGLVEALILCLTFTTLIYVLFLMFYLFTNILWMEHQLYQGLLCVAEQRNKEHCRRSTLNKIQKLNPLGGIQSLKIRNFRKEWKGEMIWHFYNKDFVIRQSFHQP